MPVEIVPNPVVAEPGEPATLPVPESRVTVGYSAISGGRRDGPSSSRRCGSSSTKARPCTRSSSAAASARLRRSGAPRGRLLRRLGIPDEERDLRARVAELDLADRFSFLPFTTNTGPIYRALDLVVFPNQGAGLGRPVLEAAAYGKPVVASGSPDGAGILVPIGPGSSFSTGFGRAACRCHRQPRCRPGAAPEAR